MRFEITAAVALLAASAHAFSDLDLQSLLNTVTSAADVDSSDPNDVPPFDATKQFVDISGEHAFQAPTAGQARGPCPGLNVLSNHAYLPRSGIADVATFMYGTNTVFNMGLDLAGILAVYGAVFDGALGAWSIGGVQHNGISGSHNNYESDSSPLRGDLNQQGSNVRLILSQFEELFNMQPDPATANYDLDVMTEFRKTRYDESIAKNPYFTYLPFSGNLVSQATYMFIYRFFANHTETQPEGILTQDILMSFMSVQGTPGNFTFVPGAERIPENWYKRGAVYGNEGLNADVANVTKKYPETGMSGCNTGKVNSYAVIDASDTTSGGYTQQQALDKPICYGMAYANKVAASMRATQAVVGEFLVPVANKFGCHEVPSLNESVYQACPGYGFYGGPSTAAAPGSIQ